MLFSKYDDAQRCVRENFTGHSPEIAMVNSEGEIWLNHVVVHYCNKCLPELQGSGESTDIVEVTEGSIARSVASVATCHPIWVIFSGFPIMELP